MAYKIPQNVRTILESLAEAVLPLEAWTRQKSPPRYDQLIPPLASVPWRPAEAEPTLSTRKLEVVNFLAQLIDDDITSDDKTTSETLAPRWRAIKADPTKYFKSPSGQSAAEWRAGRQDLIAAAKFGAFDADSSNFAFVTLAPDGTAKDAVSRREFYEACWDPLVAAYQLNPPKDAASWASFRDDLRADKFAVWPPTKAVRSSAFIKQFTVDVLRACLSQKNGAITASNPFLWERAVLIEIGENRRVGNAYTVQQAAQAVRHVRRADLVAFEIGQSSFPKQVRDCLGYAARLHRGWERRWRRHSRVAAGEGRI